MKYLHKTGVTSTNYVSTANQLANFSLAAGDGATCAFWTRPLATSTNRLLTGWSTNSGTGGHIQLNVSSGTSLIPRVVFTEATGDGASAVTSTAPSAVTINVWVHLAFTVDRGTNLLSLWVNGVLADSDSIAALGSLTATTAIFVGAGRVDSGIAHADIATAEYYKAAASEAQLLAAVAGGVGTLLSGVANRIGVFSGELFDAGETNGASSPDADGNTWAITGTECVIVDDAPVGSGSGNRSLLGVG